MLWEVIGVNPHFYLEINYDWLDIKMLHVLYVHPQRIWCSVWMRRSWSWSSSDELKSETAFLETSETPCFPNLPPRPPLLFFFPLLSSPVSAAFLICTNTLHPLLSLYHTNTPFFFTSQLGPSWWDLCFWGGRWLKERGVYTLSYRSSKMYWTERGSIPSQAGLHQAKRGEWDGRRDAEGETCGSNLVVLLSGSAGESVG